jgi:hypothetical protein
MNPLGAFDLFDTSTWFSSDTSTSADAGAVSTDTGSFDPFGWSNWLGGGQSTDISTGASDSTLADWNNYWASGGMMGADLSGTSTGTTSSDIFSGLGDFLSGITGALPGLAQTGLGVWQGVQALINQQNPSDQLVTIPGSSTPVVKRTQGGQTTYHPITDLYPNLSPDVKKAQASNLVPIILIGVSALGLLLILKKK